MRCSVICLEELVVLLFGEHGRSLAALLDGGQELLRVDREHFILVLDKLLGGLRLEALNGLSKSVAQDCRAMAWATSRIVRVCDLRVRSGAGFDRLVDLRGVAVDMCLVEDVVAGGSLVVTI